MTPQHLDAVVVGAGFGGIGAAIQLRRLGYDNFVILEREDDLGGTWHVNRYPGLAVDIPSTTYSYWFEPNPNWSRLFAPGEELKRYADHVADKYDVRRHMRFGATVSGARWEENSQMWHVALADGETLKARFLITATGFLSQPHTPDIDGINEFGGRIIHTTDWDDDYDFTGRRIGVIGTGATAVQLIPKLAERVADMTVYQRTPIYVVPKFDFPIAAPLRRLFTRIPLAHRVFRWITDNILELMMVSAVLHYRQFKLLNSGAAVLAKAHLFGSIRDRELRRRLTPDYDFGCKRPTFSNTYYRAFTEPNVHLESTSIERVEPDGIVTADGRKTPIDTLVLATGFDLWDANFPAIEVIGRDGRNLGKWWREHRFQAYQGVSMPSFPNFLNMAGPYAYSGLSYFDTVEREMRHMDRLFRELARRGTRTFEVTEDANTRFLDRMTERLDDSVFYGGDCASSRSYYFNHSGEATLLRPTSTYNAISEASRFPLNDYQFA
jgi:cation diffusion facilitator CzcD-associated flavoprotein CzcO